MPASKSASFSLLVTGARSRVAFRLREEAARLGLRFCAISRTASEGAKAADITDPAAVLRAFESERPDWVVHAAGYTDVDGCERHPQLAERVNVLGTRHVAQACRRTGARLLHLSTDYIFDGTAGPYPEEAQPNPLSVYARTKWESEKEALAECPDAVIARTCVPYDWNPHRAPNFFMWLLKKLEHPGSVGIVDDQWNTPTYVPHFAEILVELCKNDARGVFNVSGRDFCSRYDFARRICEAFGHDPARIRPAKSSALRQPARRPERAGLLVGKVEKFLGKRMLTIAEGLERARELVPA